jgi:hypothetical protein
MTEQSRISIGRYEYRKAKRERDSQKQNAVPIERLGFVYSLEYWNPFPSCFQPHFRPAPPEGSNGFTANVHQQGPTPA